MIIECNMFLPPKDKMAIGNITISDTEIVLKKKNFILATSFGALGYALAKAKPFQEIEWNEIESIEMAKVKLHRKGCLITLKNGEVYKFKLAKPDKSIAYLQEQLQKSRA